MKYLGIDWGKRNIGLAVSEGIYSSPLKQLTVRSLQSAVSDIKKIIQDENIDQVVIGRPESGEALKLVEKAVEAFKKEDIIVETTDETLSSFESKGDHSKAAAIILQNYLDENKVSNS